MQKKEYSIEVGGRPMTFTFTDLADQASGSVLVRYGETLILATAVMGEKTRDDIDYFPLTVDYEERFYAAGQILGSRFIRREGRPSEEAVLSGRVVDRTIRPLFDHRARTETQVVITVLSIHTDDPDVLAINAASMALLTSDIPWDGPASAVRIGKRKGADAFSINPAYDERDADDFEMELLACGRNGAINMMEVGALEVSEEVVTEALALASEEIEKIQAFQKKIAAEIGKQKRTPKVAEIPGEVTALFAEAIEPRLSAAVFAGKPGKAGMKDLEKEWGALVAEKFPDLKKGLAADYFEDRVNAELHRGAIEEGKRADGRGLEEIRPLYMKAGGVSSILHGSGIFYRGGTHVFSALTLGGPQDSQLLDNMEAQEEKKRFMHHYNFPPYSSGETGRMGGMNRRAIGHGALAEKALEAVIPSKEVFPYTIRLVSECLASNGSTSMGSVCASTLALMDGGVPIKAPVAGIAMGLMLSEAKSASGGLQERPYAILTDIQGPEDHHGDMDCKVAGTRAGITAVQLDIKVDAIPLAILAEALVKAKLAREHILDLIEKELPAPRPDISPNAPKIIILRIKQDQIGAVIGPGGKVIKGIKEKTRVEEIDIEDDGTIFITGKNGTAEAAAAMISDLTREYKAGERFEGTVSRITTFGAFVKLSGSAEGLVHVSEMAPFRIARVEGVVSLGEKVPVIIKEIDEQGRINLSIKRADPEFASRKGVKPEEPRMGGGRGGNGFSNGQRT